MKFSNFLFFWKKPKVIVIADNNQDLIKKAIGLVTGHSLRFQREVVITNSHKMIDLQTGVYLILNHDEDIQKLKENNPAKALTFGFQEGADFRASDLKINGGINFKINYKKNVVPVWLIGGRDKNQVYAALAAACVGTIFNLNLVKISQSLRDLT